MSKQRVNTTDVDYYDDELWSPVTKTAREEERLSDISRNRSLSVGKEERNRTSIVLSHVSQLVAVVVVDGINIVFTLDFLSKDGEDGGNDEDGVVGRLKSFFPRFLKK